MIKILSWNCNGAFRKKYPHLDQLDADILIIQECENPETSTIEYKNWAKNYLWIGENKNKGLGIFCKDDIKMEQLHWPNESLKHFLPVRINDDFNLLAVWSHHANSPTFAYIGQLWKYLQVNKAKMSDMIIAGDLNSNKVWDIWDRWWNHSDVVRELDELNIRSLYHEFSKEDQGQESQPTFFLQRNQSKKYHIDYIFADRNKFTNINDFKVINEDHWFAISDHLPIITELNVGNS